MAKKKKKVVTGVKQVLDRVALIDKTQETLSYSRLLSFTTCKKQWYLKYAKNLRTYEPNINTVFGTAVHETVQTWLTVMYEDSIKEANLLDLEDLLYTQIRSVYTKELQNSNQEHFSTPEELELYYNQGCAILEYVKKHRSTYFSSKNWHLVGVEVPIFYKLDGTETYFEGYIDLVLYNSLSNTYRIIDIKTSKKGWGKWAKTDKNKLAQLLLYKSIFSKQFEVPIDKVYVEYFIVKREINENAEFPSMRKRVQEFKPSSGKIAVGRALTSVNEFIAFRDSKLPGPAEPSKSNCMFCQFKETEDCLESYKGV